LVMSSGGVDQAFLADIVARSLVKKMSRPDNNMSALSWKRLHLSRAKLKASSRTSALLSGFAMVAMVEVQLCDSDPVPTALLITFAICTILLVSVHMLALMISTCILPHVEAVASMPGYASVDESPHESLSFYIEVAWLFSTVFGILLFMLEIIILCWVKFWNVGTDNRGILAAIIATIILIPIICLFIAFAVHFYRKVVSHKYERSAAGLQELESMATQLQTDNENQGDGNHLGFHQSNILNI